MSPRDLARHRRAVLKGVRLTRSQRSARLLQIAQLQREGKTLTTIGSKFGISAERVRQLALSGERGKR